jgi:hypothetical protein
MAAKSQLGNEIAASKAMRLKVAAPTAGEAELAVDSYVEKQVLSFQQDRVFGGRFQDSDVPLPISMRKDVPQNNFNSEDEITSSLAKIQMVDSASPVVYSEGYKRCSAVLLKILGTTMAKNLIWEVDCDDNDNVSRPMAFVNVASNLVTLAYGESADDSLVCNLFYRDMRQVLLNCISSDTEITYLYTQAQKLFPILYRHMDLWVWSITLPPLAKCHDNICVKSGLEIGPNAASIKCGRCFGRFHLGNINSSKSVPCLFPPTQEHLDQNSEEWYCHFCVKEVALADATTDSCYFLDEYGTSGGMPWFLNEAHSSALDDIRDNFPHLRAPLEALEILCVSGKTSIVNNDCPLDGLTSPAGRLRKE